LVDERRRADGAMTYVAGALKRDGESANQPDQPAGHVPGEPGVWILLCGDLSIFTVLFAAYLLRRGEDVGVFAQAQSTLNRTFGVVNTIVLLSSSLLVVFAVRAVRSHRWRYLAPRLMFCGAGVGACFVVIKAIEYHEIAGAGISPTTNEFFMYYFVLTGLHLAHVVVGLGVLSVLAILVRNEVLTRTHVAYVEGGTCFWHLVDLLWLVIFPLLFLVR
jgi:nitric oxide reductase NorE protein